MVWIESILCKNFWCDLVAQTFAFVAPFRRVLHRVSCSSETVPNAPKRKETHENMDLGSNGVDREHSLQNFRRDFVARTFALIAPFRPVLRRVSCSTKMVPNAPTQNKTHLNMSFESNGVDRERLLRNFLTCLHGTFCINCNSLAHFASSLVE